MKQKDYSIGFIKKSAIYICAATAFMLSIPSIANDSDKPIDITADEFYYDKSRELVYGFGNVEIVQDNQIIVAEKIKYERNTEDMYAIGNVAMRRDDGSVYFGDEVKLNRTNDTGAVINLKARLATQGKMASKFAEMQDKEHLTADEVVYSACDICEDNFVPNEALWQFRAKKVYLDRTEDKMYYEHARLEAFGVPVFYTPYLVTPAPGAKRKTGFLFPRFYLADSTFGYGARIPFYINIARNMDATIGARLNQKTGSVVDGQFRHKLRKGDYTLFGSITNTDKYDKSGNRLSGKEIRAHYDIKGQYYFDNIENFPMRLSVKSKRLHDPNRTYMKKYKFGQEDVLNTDVSLTNSTPHRHSTVRTLFFQDLRPDASTKTTASALPQITWISDYKISPFKLDGSILADYTTLSRPQGMSYNRFVLRPSLSKTNIWSSGIVTNADASIRSDFYNVDYNKVSVVSNYNPIAKQSGNESRFHPEFTFTTNYPLYNSFAGNRIIIDPVVQAIASPKKSNLRLVDNEDSQAPEIKASNLFSSNRYKGYDLLESGNRVNYGMRANVTSHYFKNMSAVLGQSYRHYVDPNFDRSSGMNSHFSDYVAHFTLQPNKYWVITEGARFDHHDWQLNRNEFGVTYSYKKFTGSLYHFHINGRLLDQSKDKQYKQEMQLNLGYNFYKQWWAEGYVKSKLGKSKPGTTPMISQGFALKNKNECLHVELSVNRDYTRLRDLEPATTYMLNVVIPTF